MPGKVRVGMGGWTFEPWRGVFYPEKLSQKKELAYAAEHVTSVGGSDVIVKPGLLTEDCRALFAEWLAHPAHRAY